MFFKKMLDKRKRKKEIKLSKKIQEKEILKKLLKTSLISFCALFTFSIIITACSRDKIDDITANTPNMQNNDALVTDKEDENNAVLKTTPEPTFDVEAEPTSEPAPEPIKSNIESDTAPTSTPEIIKEPEILLLYVNGSYYGNAWQFYIGDSKTTYVSTNSSNKAYSYSSDNESVASVDSNGTITAKSIGKAKITIKNSDGLSDYVMVNVTEKPVYKAPASNNGSSSGSYSSQSEGTTVWISSTGKKYHKYSSCSNMKNPSSVSLDDAISRGLTPCKKCYK